MKVVILRCPLCWEKFKYNVADGFPDDCLVCHQRIASDRADDAVSIPAFLSSKTKATDAVARQVMDGSETRAQMAADMAGVPVSEMSGLKVTDLSDRRDAEFSTKPVVNDVTRHMDSMKARGMPVGFQRQQAMEASALAHQGGDSYAGAKARSMIWDAHHKGSAGAAPEMVPLEIRNNPNYVRRG